MNTSINNLNNFFQNIILVRGFEYYKSGKVTLAYQDGDDFYALIKGQKDYYTSIKVVGEELVSGECSCIHFMNNQNCKHMASLAYYAVNNDLKTGVSIDQVLTSLTKEQSDKLIKMLLKRNDNLQVVSLYFLKYLSNVKESFYFMLRNTKILDDLAKEKILDALLAISTNSLYKSYDLLTITLEKYGEDFKVEALRFIEITAKAFDDYTDFHLLKRLIDYSYLRTGIFSILLLNNNNSLLVSLSEYLYQRKDESILMMSLTLESLMIINKGMARSYALNNLVKDPCFLVAYTKLDKSYEYTLIKILENYSNEFRVSKKMIYDYILKSNNQEVINQAKNFY